MPLLRLLRKSYVQPYIREERQGYKTDPALKKMFGDILPSWTGVAYPKRLTFEVIVEGYPSRHAKGSSHGEWGISSALHDAQQTLPIQLRREDEDEKKADPLCWTSVTDEPDGALWLFAGKVYSTDDRDLTAEDVRAVLNVETNKRRLTLEKAHALQAMTENYDKPKRRDAIPQSVRLEVWRRDGGHCVECNSQERLEFDHVIPVSMGGANTARNIQLLCETCNRRKGASLG